jgi:hypothetical protein
VADYNDYEDAFQEKVDETPLLKNYELGQQRHEETNTYKLDTTVYMPSTRTAFYKFINKTYAEQFNLPTVVKSKTLDPAACERLMSGGPSRVEPFLYQLFIKEYMRMASPYRGMVVYHGLGSGKTCSAILAAEALYGQSNRRMIVMTPKSLRANFMNDIVFACGFRHFSPTNFWTALPLTKRSEDGTLSFIITHEMYARSILSLSRDFLDKLKERKAAKKEDCVVWIPDFSKPPSESNFKALEPTQQDEIMAQINEMITNRVEFISYNGITAKRLKDIACTNPTYFDNSVIVIDEIHNLIRLMNGSIIPYLTTRTGVGVHRKVKAEKVGVGRWEPLLCSEPTKNYKRGYLLYRLLCGAKNSKIIGLSGTPLINYPEELGILANVLAGYIDCAEITLATADPVKAEAFRSLAEKDPRVDFIRMDKGDTYHRFTLSVFQEGYKKVLASGEEGEAAFEGVRQSDDEDAQVGIREVVARLRTAIGPALIPDEPTFSAKERLPIEHLDFSTRFITRDTAAKLIIRPQNMFVLKKRLTGLVSYYRGAKDDFFPTVTVDETIECGLSDHTALMYYSTRNKEIEAEERIVQKKTGDKLEPVFAMVEIFGVNPPPDSYQFRSRALCNFAFPPTIKRPYPREEEEDLEEGIEAEIGEDIEYEDESEDGGASVRAEIEGEEAEAERELEETDEEGSGTSSGTSSEESGSGTTSEESGSGTSSGTSSEESSGTSSEESGSGTTSGTSSEESGTTTEGDQSGGADEEGVVKKAVKAVSSAAAVAASTVAAAAAGTVEAAVAAVAPEAAIPYPERIRRAMALLNTNRDRYMNLTSPTPSAQLATYSRKLHEILTRMRRATGPVMVYSQFKTVEGLGVLGIALKANGYDEIAIERWDGNTPIFTKDTLTTIRKGPSAGIKRFITFSGDSGNTPVQRAVLINLFNGQWAKLPRGVKSLFEAAGFNLTKKYTHGEICACIGITSAGAEGISLRNVRQVHIMEPYWNMVRIEQVKGRAVRICSHMDLPIEERTVEIYTYIATFTQKQLTATPEKGGIPPRIRKTDMREDRVLTTDNNVYNVSKRKHEVNEIMLHVLKETAVDCKMNQPDNELLQCFDPVGKNPYMFDPDLNRDEITTVSEYGAGPATAAVAAAAAVAVAAPTLAERAASTPRTMTAPLIGFVKGGVTTNFLVGPVNLDDMTVFLYAENDKEFKTPLKKANVVPSASGEHTYTGIKDLAVKEGPPKEVPAE